MTTIELPRTTRPAPDAGNDPHSWNDTARPYPRDTPIHRLVLERAAERPEAPAVSADGGGLTYGQLARRSARLAAVLAARGVGLETRVGVAVERSPELVVALLAVLRAGGAYVPLDPAYPAERLAFLVADARVPLVLATSSSASALPAGTPLLLLDELAAELAVAGDDAAVLPEVPAEALAYVMYTSGSTGTPKGVAVTHRNVVRLVAGSDFARLGPGEAMLACAPAAFDASTLEIWGPLANGGRVALPAPGPLSVDDLAAEIAGQGVTALWLTAGLFHQVVDERPSALAPLSQLLAGGDVLSPAHVARVREAFPDLALTNGYGPTENTTFTCCPRVGDPHGPVPIGRPFATSPAPGLTGALAPAAVGEEGELFAGGDGVARGYLDRPGLTAERFVPDPFGPPGARLYRTGDLARRRPDGALDFLGRRDGQVKLRGFRVEPGEVEAALARAPGVGAAAVGVRGEGDAKRLVAWVVGPAAEDRAALRAWLAERLPEHLVPSAYVAMPALPLTVNGKVDRRALPDPGGRRPDLDVAWAPPEDDRQRRLAALWGEVLGIEGAGSEGIGVDDDLIALGGHSLAAARIAARVHQAVGIDLPVVEVFAHPTVRSLAVRIAELASGGRELPPLVAGERPASIPLSFQQEQVWFLQRLAPEMIAYNFQCTVRFRGRLDVDLLERALAEIVRRHEVLRTEFVETPAGPEQRVREPWQPRVERVSLSHLPAAEREAAAEDLVPTLVRRRFEVDRLPLVAWTAVELAEDDHLLVQVEHHFVHDGWSISVLFRELAAVYAAFAAGRPSPLAPMPVQYADFAVWQRKALAGELLEEQLAYWRGRLADPPPALDLPSDRPRPPRQSFRGAAIDEELPPELYEALRMLARREGVTLYVTLMAAFQALVARVSGQRRFLLGSGIANRRLAASEGLIGMIVNTVALGADLEGDPTFRDLLARVRREVLAAQAHPDLPLERLVADLQPERDLSRNPLFQVMFSFHDSPVPDLEFAGLSGKLRERHNGSSKVDLNVIARPRAEQRLGRAAAEEDRVLRVLWEYSTDLFDRDTVAALWRRWLAVLAAVVEDPGQRLSELPLASEDERRQVVEEHNATGRDFGPFRAVHRRVLAHAEAAPAATALVAADGREVSYGELAVRARGVAGELAARRLGRGEAVAVLAGRTPEMVAGLLGVLEAGGAYLPLDPATPPERVAALLADAGARLLLVDRDDAPVPPGVEAVRLDGAPSATADAAPFEPTAHDLAYLIFTSGSTGRPKGVAVPHGGLANLVDWHLDAYGLAAGDRAASVAGLGFDATVWDLWPPLAAGAAVCLIDDARRTDPPALVDWLAERRVSVAFLPTPLAEAALALPWPPETALRFLLTGGDVLHAHPPAGLPFRLVNHYGPTEGSVVASAGEAAPGGAGLPDIGRPIANVRLLVLDEALAPVPPGVPGELYLGGAGLARGYAGRPAWTAERFVPDPFGDGGRLYATGDRARWSRDGRLVFLGRRDGQVKVRGVRIELGEVEAALCAEAGVAAAVAAAPPGPGGEPWLVAWWQPEPGLAAELEELLEIGRAHV